MNKETNQPNVLRPPQFKRKSLPRRAGQAVVRAVKDTPGQAALVAAATLFSGGQLLAQHNTEGIVADKKAPVCAPSDETQEFTFGAEQGINNAIFKIKGSGNGEGAVCWDDAEAIVDAAVGDHVPNYNQTIVIPKEIHPIKQHESNK